MLKVPRRFAVWVVFVFLAAPVNAAITGEVLDAVTKLPVEGARVRIQATTGEPVITNGDGLFTIEEVPAGSVMVTAVVTFDSDAPINYITEGAWANDGDHRTIYLPRLPEHDPEGYGHHDDIPPSGCGSCHWNQHSQWQASTHSHAARNDWVLDLFEEFKQTHDEEDTGFCATCHAPLEDVLSDNEKGVFIDDVADDSHGVSCLACHQMAEVDPANVSKLHHRGNAQYYFPGSSSQFFVWGPLDDVVDVMAASYQPQFSEAVFCASCHEYDNPNNPGIPGQTTYSEWQQSPFAQPGENRKVCQDCHMPPADGPGSIGGWIDRPAEQRRNHRTVGATETTLQDAIELQVDVYQQGSGLVVDAEVFNNGAGHSFPTGISIRNAILHVTAEYQGEPLAQTGGPVVPFYGSANGSSDPQKDLAGRPGKGFARVLEGRINGQGPTVYPVLFIDAENVREETRIPSGESDHSAYRFDLSGVPEGATVEISARLLYRRAWRNLEVRMGWTETPAGGDIEILVASESLEWTAQAILDPVFSDRFESAEDP